MFKNNVNHFFLENVKFQKCSMKEKTKVLIKRNDKISMRNSSSTQHSATDSLEDGVNFTTASVPFQLWWGNKLLGRFSIKISVFKPSE